MKKTLMMFVIFIMIALLLDGPLNATISDKDDKNLQIKNVLDVDFTHNVFVEYATTTWCPSCPTASEAIYSIYQNDNYPFNYVSLVSDVNNIAKRRSRLYNNIVIPSVYIDGGDLNYFGHAGNVSATEEVYRDLIEERGINEDINPIDMNMDVTWRGDAKITVTVTIKNNGDNFYFGMIRSYITEIESRWLDNNGDPYHFGFLDFALNRPIFLSSQQTKTITTNWNGKGYHGGQTYGDITIDNVMVFSVVSHYLPNLRQGYQNLPNYDQKYLAFFVDQSVGAIPESN